MHRSGYSRLRLILTFTLLTVLGAFPALAVQPGDQGRRSASRQVTRASWYGTAFAGRRTAAGTVFNPEHLTAAHRTIHMGSRVKVTELRSGRSVIVQITDRGPYSPGRGIDLSYAAARQIGIVRRGVARVQVELLDREQPAADAPVFTAASGQTRWWLPKAIVE